MIDAIATSSFNMQDLKDAMKKFSKPQEVNCEIEFNPDFDLDRIYGMRGMRVFEVDYMQPEQWTGKWLVEGNEFFTYWDGEGQPPSWAIYCGFVKKEMRKTWYAFQMPRSIIMNGVF